MYVQEFSSPGAPRPKPLITQRKIVLDGVLVLCDKKLSKRRDDLDLRCLDAKATRVQIPLSPTLKSNVAKENAMKDGWDYEEYINFVNYLVLQMMIDEDYFKFSIPLTK